MTFVRLLSAFAASALLAGPALAQTASQPAPAAAPAPASSGDVLQTLQTKGDFTTFLKLMDAAELSPTIKGLQNVTLFAPTDQAYSALAPGVIDNWLKPENKQALQKLMLYHVYNGPITSAQVLDHKGPVQTPTGLSLTLDGTGGKVKVNDANATLPELKATNGYIFVIDKVLSPPA
jgi:uncharacterized surface protein with fasciclin (FAS1) repeats